MAETVYPAGALKRDPASGAVAIRTVFPDDDTFGHQAWLVASTNIGARNATSAQVAAWPDITD